MAETKFTAQSYRDAAKEHLSQARFLHYNAHRYFLAHYISGIAIECILRAHGKLQDDDFTGRHGLNQLATRADFFRLARGSKTTDYVSQVTEANLRWRSSHRYITEAQLLSYLKGIELDQKIRGDQLKYSSQRMYDLAEQIVGLGVLKWKNV